MGTVRVRVTQLGFDGMQRRREGEVFNLVDKERIDPKTKKRTIVTGEDQFSAQWMEPVSAKHADEDEEEKRDKRPSKGKTTRASDDTRI